MMRLRSLIVFLILASGTAHAETATERALKEAKQYLTPCNVGTEDERGVCRVTQSFFVRDYVGAKSGDYEDWRNVAFMLSLDRDGAVVRNPLQACAWHLLIMASGDARVGVSERTMAGETCGKLDEGSRMASANRAAALNTEIRLHPARKLPEPRQQACKGPLDGTAYPLGVDTPPLRCR